MQSERIKNLIIKLLSERGEMTVQELSDMMFLIDLESYKKLGKTITGLLYTKEEENEIRP